jgi:hypothetical protein|tara:strand:+ start:2807 stop:3526 length:720 start_codon:yes stop_codon:yes gene_type:complete
MSKYASGKRAYGISDRSGFRYRYKDLRKEWNGAIVGPDEFESKHPQLFPRRKVFDAQALRDARPEVNLEAERNVNWGWNPVGSPSQDYFPISRTEALGQVGSVTISLDSSSGNLTVYPSGVSSTSAIGSATVSSNVTRYVVTVDSYLGSNVYYIDGARQPTLSLSEGSIYLFDWSAATSHPLRFSTTSDGTHNSGSEYTTGVVKDDSAYTTQITVAGGAPTLYYYCSNHSGMGGQANTP